MVTETEGSHEIGSQHLYTKSWSPDGLPKAKFILIHGYSDHINRYQTLFNALAERSIAVHAFDQRGWGRSVTKPSEKGLCGPTSQVLSDIDSFIKAQLPSVVPLFVMGHSMGGAEVIHYASSPQYEDTIKQVQGWLLSAPFVRFPKGFEPNRIKEVVGKFAAKLLPHFQLFERLPPANLTRNPEEAQSIEDDVLMHNTGTLQGLSDLLDRALSIDTGKTVISNEVKSLWVGHGTEDKATSYEASKSWFEKQTNIPDRTFRTYDKAFHVLHADLEETTKEFCNDVGEWILARSGEKVAEPKL